MNESIAMVKANVTLLEKEEARYKAELNDLTAKVKASIQAGRDDLARTLPSNSSSSAAPSRARRGSWRPARAAYDKALNVRPRPAREGAPDHEAMNAIPDYRRSQWQKKVADAMEQFEVAASVRLTTMMSARSNRPPRSTRPAWKWRWATSTAAVSRSKKRPRNCEPTNWSSSSRPEMGLLTPEVSAPAPDKTIGERGHREDRVIHGGSYGSAN